MNIYQYLILK